MKQKIETAEKVNKIFIAIIITLLSFSFLVGGIAPTIPIVFILLDSIVFFPDTDLLMLLPQKIKN